jgi:hypothetical protein
MDHPLMIAAMAAAGGAYGAYTSGGAAAPSDPGGAMEGLAYDPGTLNLIENQQILNTMNATPINEGVSGVAGGLGAAGGGGGTGGPSSADLVRYGSQGARGLAGAMEDPVVTREMLDPAAQAEYDAALEGYNSQVKAYERWNQLNTLYEQKLAEFEAKQELYNRYRGLQGRQAGILSDIRGSIASNPFYDPEENLTGIQSMFV